jgi:NAD(P)-dependent dehydrogenase (short-subunit alcohol dehydrogenase family)
MTIDNIDFLNIPTNTILIANYPANFVEYLLPHVLFDEFERKISELIPMGRMCLDWELTGAVQFLASNASSYMTGQNLVIDGGRSIW